MKKLIPYLLFVFFILLLVQGNIAYEATSQALYFWFNKLVPTMFVTMVVVTLALHYQAFDTLGVLFSPLIKILNINKQAFSLLIACLFVGSPGSTILLDSYVQNNQITNKAAQRLLLCVSLSTPSFIVLTCGVLFFDSIQIGFILWFSQIFITLLLLLFYRYPMIEFNTTITDTSFFITLKKAISTNALALFYIGGYIMLFLTFFNLSSQFLPPLFYPIFLAASEFSLGSQLISTLILPLNIKVGLVAACIGFNGLCVHLQIFSMSEHIDKHYSHFLFLRIIQSLLSFSLAIILVSLLL